MIRFKIGSPGYPLPLRFDGAKNGYVGMTTKAVIVAMSPLVLMNSLECARELGLPEDELLVLFSGKSDNPGKFSQARKICQTFGIQAFFHLRLRPSFVIPGWPFFMKFGRRIVERLQKRFNQATFLFFLGRRFPELPPEFLIGSGEYLQRAKKYAPNSQVYLVDSGVSALYGYLGDQLSADEKAFSLYSPEALRIPSDRVLHNRHELLLEQISTLGVREETALFVSTNTRGKYTNDDDYNRALCEAKRRHRGELIYYRRGNESRSAARKLCQRHGLRLVNIDWPVEMYIFLSLGCVPGKIFSTGSSALWFFRKMQTTTGTEVLYLVMPRYKSGFATDILEHLEQNSRGNGFVQIVEAE